MNRRLLVCISFAVLALTARAETVVIVNPANPVAELKREQVIDLFMGGQINFPDGNPALPIDHLPDSATRQGYYHALTGKTVAQINAYWARLMFTGRASPPRVLRTPDAVLKAVMENRDAIAYIDDAVLNGKVKVVFRLK